MGWVSGRTLGKKASQQMKHDCKLVLGNGGRIRFWVDKWNGENPLCNLFPTLYAITASKGKMIGEVWESLRGEGGWNLRFFRPFNDWELDEAQRLISFISGNSVRQRVEDTILWDVDKKGQYTVKANYMHMENACIDNFLVGLNWNSWVPPKVSVFTWEVWWGKVLIGDQSKRRGFQLANICPMCKEEEENLDHLFMHCPTIWRFWALLTALSGMEWVCPL